MWFDAPESMIQVLVKYAKTLPVSWSDSIIVSSLERRASSLVYCSDFMRVLTGEINDVHIFYLLVRKPMNLIACTDRLSMLIAVIAKGRCRFG